MKKIFNFLKWFLLIILGLIFLVFLLLQTPPVQNVIKNKALKVVNKQLTVPVSIDKIQLTFFDHLVIKKLLWGEPDKDTLLFLKRFSVDISLFDLLKKEIHVESIKFKGLDVHLIKFSEDSLLNIVKALPESQENDTIKTVPDSSDVDSSNTSFAFMLDRVELNDIHFTLKDEVDSSVISAGMENLELILHSLDLEQNHYIIQSFHIDGLFFTNILNKEVIEEESVSDTAENNMDYKVEFLEDVALNNVNVKMENTWSNQMFQIKHGNLRIVPPLLDLKNQRIKIAQIKLEDTGFEMRSPSVISEPAPEPTLTEKQDSTTDLCFETIGWNCIISQFLIENNSFKYQSYDFDKKAYEDTIRVDSISTEWNLMVLDSSHFEVHISEMKAMMDEMNLSPDISTFIQVTDSAFHLTDFGFSQRTSYLQLNASVYYGSIAKLIAHADESKLNVALDAFVNTSDFKNGIKLTDFGLKENVPIRFKARLSGDLQHFTIPQVNFSVGDAVHMNMNGDVWNTTDMDKMNGSLTLNDFSIYRDSLVHVIQDTLLPPTITLPDTIMMFANLKGGMHKLNGDLSVKSSFGGMDLRLYMDKDTIPGNEFLTTNIQVHKFDLGKLLQKGDSLQKLSLELAVAGFTENYQHPELNIDGRIDQFKMMGYSYNGLVLKGYVEDDFYDAKVMIEDPNLSVQLNGGVDFRDSVEHNMFADLNINRANFKELHLMEESTSLTGGLLLNVSGNSWDHLHGKVLLRNLDYEKEQQSIVLDSLKVNMMQVNDSLKYSLDIYNIFMDDSLFMNRLAVNAIIKNKESDFNYKVFERSEEKSDTASVLLEGNGNFKLRNDSIAFATSLLWYENLLKDSLHLNISASQISEGESSKRYALKMDGEKINVNAAGTITGKDENQNVDALLKVDSLDFSLIEPMAKMYLNKFTGFLNGEISVKGNMNNPNINGFLKMNNTTINPSFVNTDFNIKQGQINIQNNVISFDNYLITDANGNTADFNATFNIKDMNSPIYNVSFNANDFLLLDKEEDGNSNYFGHISADLKLKANGDAKKNDVFLSANFNKDADLTYTVISEAPTAAKDAGVVQFVVDSVQEGDSIANLDIAKELEAVKGMNLVVNLGISDKLKVNLITDPVSDEKLDLQGNGNLSLTVEPGGQQSLTGQYTIKKGSYTLRLFDVLKKEFYVKEGSSLTWSGDIMNATANLSAIYKIRTNAIALMQAVTGQLSESEYEAYNSLIPVQVVMNLKGNLLSPSIDFDIELQDKNVNSKIESAINELNENESELNMQVFSLLLLNSFSSGMNDMNLSSYSLENTARQSISNLLTNQLNRFSQQHLKGMDVNFDIDSYNQETNNQSSARTDVSVGVSQNLFNDRLKVTVGGNVSVEESNTGTSTNDLTGDFEVEYKINKAGTKRLKAFNKTEYEDELSGDVMKTGVAFLFVKDFIRFTDLFGSGKKSSE